MTIALPTFGLAATAAGEMPSAAGITAHALVGKYQGVIARLEAWLFDEEAETPGVDVVIVPARARLDYEITPEVQKFLRFYSAGRGKVTARVGLERSETYREMAERVFMEEGVPVELIWLAQVESNWVTDAESAARAKGIWQFIPETGERFGLECDGPVDERCDPEKSTRAAAKYLKWLGKRYKGDWLLAMGAYNCGEGGMDRAIERAGSRNFWQVARAGALPNETANYVPAILATITIAQDPERFDIS